MEDVFMVDNVLPNTITVFWLQELACCQYLSYCMLHSPTSDQASVYTELCALLFTLHHTLCFALHGRWVTLQCSLITAQCEV